MRRIEIKKQPEGLEEQVKQSGVYQEKNKLKRKHPEGQEKKNMSNNLVSINC